jgi:hypothetical protein
MSSDPKKAKSGSRVQIHLPADLEPTYANFALITNSRSEIVIDFAQVLPQVKQARVKNRVVMTAFNAKLLLRALGDHITRFETQFGEITLPEGTTLADQLFRSSQPNHPNEDPPNE